MFYIFINFSYDPSLNIFPSKYTCIKNKNAPPETISTQCDLYGQQKQFAYFIIVTKLVHKNRASILFLSFKVLQCTSMQEAATHRTRLCLGLGVTHVDKYGLAFLGSTGVPIYKGTF